MRRATRILLLSAALLGAGIAAPATSSAAFHLMSISEVYPGTPLGTGEDSFVELQMYAPGQSLVTGHSITIRNPAGAVVHTFQIPDDVPNSGNQRTILIGDTSTAVTPDFTDPGLYGSFNYNGGAVCFDNIDCVAYGNFSGSTPSPAGSPAIPGGFPDQQSIARDISRGCATLLEASDDTNNSSADFDAAAPSPRNNGTAPTEKPCDPPADGTRPQTRITGVVVRNGARRATVRFAGSDNRPGRLRFQCRLDQGAWRACSPPRVYRNLKLGRHTVAVRARDAAGNVDRTPAKRSFRIRRPAP